MRYAGVAIVRNEEASVSRLLSAPVERWTIVDTGSIDGTIEALLGQPGVTIHHRDWVNFGHNRSEAFALARGTADWLLALDADMTVEIDDDFEPDPAIDAYWIDIGPVGFSYRLPLLLRGDLPWQSVGAVHEYTCLPGRGITAAPTDKVRIAHHGTDRSSREKTLWHAEMLEAELAENPDNGRSIFYLAQTYAELRDPRAFSMYDRRARMPGWDEETFYARYQRALLSPTWPAKLLGLIDTWESRPWRLEPAYELARELNSRGKHHVAYQFASTPVEPTTDILFVHQSVWDWGMAFERSIAAWWLHLWDEFDRLTAELLDNPRLPSHIRAQVIANSEIERAA